MSTYTNSRGTKVIVHSTSFEVFEDDRRVTYRISNIETIMQDEQKMVIIVMKNGKEYQFGQQEDDGFQTHISSLMD